MLQDLLNRQRQYLDVFFDSLDLTEVEKLFDKLANNSGIICFSGVGKSGIIAEKIAMTMISTGTRALYISPTNALYGDLGIVSDQDIFLLFSKSGETEELLNLVPFIRNKGATLVAVVSDNDSRLAKACDMTIYLPIEKELCPFDLAPTISTTIQLIFGDLLAIALMQAKNFSLDQYAMNHPAGRIGKRITMKVRDLMLTGENVPLCSPQDKLVDVLVELSNKRCGCILVTDEEKQLNGIFTDGDLRRALQSHGPDALQSSIESLMVTQPKTIHPEILAWEAMKVMEADQKHPIMVLPVIEEQKVVGVIKMHDIVQSGI